MTKPNDGGTEMSDMPETDALDCELHNPRVLSDRYSEMRDFARKLERERDEARASRDLYMAQCVRVGALADKWKEVAEGLAKNLTWIVRMADSKKAWSIRTIARDALAEFEEATQTNPGLPQPAPASLPS